MQLLPQNAQERMLNRSDDYFDELPEKFTKEDWDNIDSFTKALRFNKPPLSKGSSLETVGVTQTQKEWMLMKKQIGFFFVSLFIAIGINGRNLMENKGLLSQVVEVFSRKLIEFLYETYENRISIRVLETVHDKYGFSEVEFDEIFKDQRGLEIQLVTKKGTITIIFVNKSIIIYFYFFNRNRRLNEYQV
jgi:hypothetical protein